MKQFLKRTNLLKSIVYLLLISQLCSNTLSYCYWTMDTDSELIELSKVEDTESEEEDKNEEKKHEVRIDFYNSSYDELIATCMILHAKDFLSLHLPEVSTPPPKHLSFL